MMDADHIDQLVKEWAADIDTSIHPDNNILTAHAMGKLSPKNAEALLDHVAICGQCSMILIQLGDLSNIEAITAPEVDPQIVNAGLTALQKSLEAEEKQLPVERKTRWWFSTSAYIPLFAAVVGFVVGGVFLGKRQPIQPNIPIVDLFTEQDLERGLGEIPRIPKNSECVFILNPVGDIDLQASYVAQVVHSNGRILESVTLRPFSHGNFSVALPRDLLEQSREIRLLDPEKQLIATFKLLSE